MRPETTRRAWRVASEIVERRPWLDISWIGSSDAGHLAVHDGAFGAALHFDDDEGPTWEPRSAPVRELEWEDATEIGSVLALGETDWLHCWGAPAPQDQMTSKAAIYALIAQLVNHDSGDVDGHDLWTALPAKLLHDSDEGADSPLSALSLADDFPSLAERVDWYVDQISGPSWGVGKVWHEPLWVVNRDGSPRVVVDEAGGVHLTFGSLLEAVELLSVAADLGGIEDPHSFEILDALPRADGGLPELARRIRRSPGEVLRAVKPDQADPDAGTR